MPARQDRLDIALGRVLRSARQRAGLTMQQLAEQADISQPHLSQLENGKAAPSINTLYRLATALRVSPQDLLPSAPGDEPVLVRATDGERTPIAERADAAVSRVLLGSPGRALQVQEVVAEPGSWLGDWFDHEGEEFLYLVEGTLLVEIDGAAPVVLQAGDGIWYSSARPHRWRAETDERVRVLAVSAVPASRSDSPHGS